MPGYQYFTCNTSLVIRKSCSETQLRACSSGTARLRTVDAKPAAGTSSLWRRATKSKRGEYFIEGGEGSSRGSPADRYSHRFMARLTRWLGGTFALIERGSVAVVVRKDFHSNILKRSWGKRVLLTRVKKPRLPSSRLLEFCRDQGKHATRNRE